MAVAKHPMPPNRWPAEGGTTPVEDLTNRMDLVGQLIGSAGPGPSANAGPGYEITGARPSGLTLVGGNDPASGRVTMPPVSPPQVFNPDQVGRLGGPMPPNRWPTSEDIGIHPDMVSQPSIYQQLHPDFYERLMALAGAVRGLGGGLDVFSAARNAQRQNQLFQAALQRFGGDEKLAAKVVAKPGESLHDPLAGIRYGMGPGAVAGDLRGDLAMAYRLAPRFGLHFPLTSQPWHAELAGLPSL